MQFREKLSPMSGSLYDERLYRVLTRNEGMPRRYDALIIGAGAAGWPLPPSLRRPAQGAAARGA